MTYQVGHAEALLGVEVKHSCYQILELLREVALWLSLPVYLPELFRVMLCDVTVERVVLLGCLVERVRSRVHDEQDASKGKHVDDFSLIWLLEQNFWRHVAQGAFESPIESTAITAFERSSKTKV